MRFILEIDLGNAAFEPVNGDEIARILRTLAPSVEGFPLRPSRGKSYIRDVNGNTVGFWDVKRAAPRKARA